MCPGAQFTVTLNTTTLNDPQKIHTLVHSAVFGAFNFLPFQHLLPSFPFCLSLHHFLDLIFPRQPDLNGQFGRVMQWAEPDLKLGPGCTMQRRADLGSFSAVPQQDAETTAQHDVMCRCNYTHSSRLM